MPQWALGNEGCMVRALPALTILYLPESAAVQLTADCGMAGVKKVQCTGNVVKKHLEMELTAFYKYLVNHFTIKSSLQKRDDLLKELSCADEEDLSTASFISTGSSWPGTSDSSFSDQDTTNEVTTEESITTEHKIDINQPRDISATSLPHFIYPQTQYKAPSKVENVNRLNSVLLTKDVNLGENQDNNLHSNFVPKTAEEDNVLTSDQLEKLEDERHKQHKMLHEEIARVGNVNNIFTQPTDHFIPPLVMAKAKISDDMTVLSLAEKHAQQLAEKQFSKQNLNKGALGHSYLDNYEISGKVFTLDIKKPLIATTKPSKWKDNKKEILKNHSPKKYVNEKHDVKTKTLRLTEAKPADAYKVASTPIPSTSTVLVSTAKELTTVSTTEKKTLQDTKKGDAGDNYGIDLTVILNDAPLTSEEQPSFSGDVAKLENIQNRKVNSTEQNVRNVEVTSNSHIDVTTTPETKTAGKVTTSHEIIKITIISDDDTLNNTTVFEVTTKMPVFKDNVLNITTVPFSTTHPKELSNTENPTTMNHENTTAALVEKEFTTVPITHFTSTISTSLETENLSTAQPILTSTETNVSTDIVTITATQHVLNSTEHTHEEKKLSATTVLPVTVDELDNNTNINFNTSFKESVEKTELNSAEYHEMLMNMTDHRQTEEEEDTTDGEFQSPLLSGVMEPAHRPPRTRRPQQPNRNKFNPFRILG